MNAMNKLPTSEAARPSSLLRSCRNRCAKHCLHLVEELEKHLRLLPTDQRDAVLRRIREIKP